MGVLRSSGSKNEDGEDFSIFGAEERRLKIGGFFDLSAPKIGDGGGVIFGAGKSKNPPPSIFGTEDRRTLHLQSSLFGPGDRVTPYLRSSAPKNRSKIGRKKMGCDFFGDEEWVSLNTYGRGFFHIPGWKYEEPPPLPFSKPDERKTPIFHLLSQKNEEPPTSFLFRPPPSTKGHQLPSTIPRSGCSVALYT